jgi:hypothetical protein
VPSLLLLLQVEWGSMTPGLQALLLRTLLLHLPFLSCRETVVAVWSLGKANFSYRPALNREVAAAQRTSPAARSLSALGATAVEPRPAGMRNDSPGGRQAEGEEEQADASADERDHAASLPMLQLQIRFHRELAAKLEQILPAMSLFDTESLLVGLGLMEVSEQPSHATRQSFN